MYARNKDFLSHQSRGEFIGACWCGTRGEEVEGVEEEEDGCCEEEAGGKLTRASEGVVSQETSEETHCSFCVDMPDWGCK